MILIDSSAWIEYFEGSKQGVIVKGYIEKNQDVLTPSIVLAELSIKAAKEKLDFNEHLNFIKSQSMIIGLNDEIIKNIGVIYLKQRKIKSGFGIVDSIVYATSSIKKSMLITKDQDFEGLDNVEILK